MKPKVIRFPTRAKFGVQKPAHMATRLHWWQRLFERPKSGVNIAKLRMARARRQVHAPE